MADGFPILKLEDAAQKCVLRRLRVMDIIAFALLSKKAFDIIRRLKIKVGFLNVAIGTNVRIFPFLIQDTDEVTWDFHLAEYSASAQPIPLAKPDRVEVRERDGTVLQVWENFSLNLREWIQFFNSVLEDQEGIALDISSDLFDQTTIEKTFEGIKIKHIDLHGSVPVPSLIADAVSIDECQTGSFANQKMLLQNNDRVYFGQPKVRILDHMLMCNAKHICCEINSIQERDLNKFLKGWRKGYYPRLERLDKEMHVNFGLEGGDMMKDIQFNEIPENKVKKYDKQARQVCQIRNAKGVLAEIRVVGNGWCMVNIFFGRDFVY